MEDSALFQNFHSRASSSKEIILVDAEEHLDDLPLPELQQLIAHVDTQKIKCDVREQLTDGGVLLQQTVSLFTCLKEENKYCMGISPAEFISGILKHFDKNISLLGIEEDGNGFQKNVPKIDWDALGKNGVEIFSDVNHGCSTMMGSLDIGLKSVKHRKFGRIKIPDSVHIKPELLDNSNNPDLQSNNLNQEKNMDAEVKRLHRRLLKEKILMLDTLLFEDSSFGRAVEKLFALSFLVRDGSAEITLSENCGHYIVPRNAPTAEERLSGIQDTQFVFRLDYKEWKEKQQKGENIAAELTQMDIKFSPKNDDDDGMESANASANLMQMDIKFSLKNDDDDGVESANASTATRGLYRSRKKIKLKNMARNRRG